MRQDPARMAMKALGRTTSILVIGLVCALGGTTELLANSSQPNALMDRAALGIIERVAANAGLVDHYRVQIQTTDVAYRAPGQPVVTEEEERLYPGGMVRGFIEYRQSDGSTLLTNRVDTNFEWRAPNAWMGMRNIGGDGHGIISFADEKWSYSFWTRHPESISRHAADNDRGVLQYVASDLVKYGKQAQSIRLLGREVTRGILCEVIELSMHGNPKDSMLRWGDKQATYYIGVADNFVHRIVEFQGLPARRFYRESLFDVDPAFEPREISHERFLREVKHLRKDGSAPPVVDDR